MFDYIFDLMLLIFVITSCLTNWLFTFCVAESKATLSAIFKTWTVFNKRLCNRSSWLLAPIMTLSFDKPPGIAFARNSPSSSIP